MMLCLTGDTLTPTTSACEQSNEPPVRALLGLNKKEDKELYSIPPVGGPPAAVPRCSDPRQGDPLLDSVRARFICRVARKVLLRAGPSNTLSAPPLAR